LSLRLRAVVLAAGLGQRLRPLTLSYPKPLLPILGRPLVQLTLARLQEAGCEAVALNLHHLGGEIESALGRSFGSMPLVYSHEEALLGTLGALVPLRRFVCEADYVFLVNGDSLCEWPFEELLRQHLEHRPLATLLLARRGDLEEFRGGIGIDEECRVVSMPGGPLEASAAERLVFAGAHVFSGELVRDVDAGFADIVTDLYRPLLAAGSQLRALPWSGSWDDLGTPRRYLAAIRSRLPGPRGWVSEAAAVDTDAELSSTAVEDLARVGRRARAIGSLLMRDSRLAPGASIDNVILGPGAYIDVGARVADAMVTVLGEDGCLSAGSVVADGMVHTPLDVS